MKKIAITTGDANGIGLEIAAKALHELGPQKDAVFTLFISHNSPQHYYKDLLKQKFKLNVTDKFNGYTNKLDTLQVVSSNNRPTFWVEEVLNTYSVHKTDALVTGPLSKTESYETHKIKGHTDLFRQTYNQLFMCFLGLHFNTLLLTDHISLRDALDTIHPKLYTDALKSLESLKIKNNHIGMVGINPHAGESGLLGFEDSQILEPFITTYNNSLSQKFRLSKPLPPDTAFLKNNWKKFGMFLCPFHDIGLSAFKTVHGLNDGIQVTLGLPFLRTSVDHGTAYDIFNKDIADFGSMKMSIQYALLNK